jgi:hypothetical protein
MKTQATKIQATTNYRMFSRSDENRGLNEGRHRKLLASMKKRGFIKTCPIIVKRDASGKLIVIDGQHRLYYAEMLSLPVYWVEDIEGNIDVAELNGTPVPWTVRDYAELWSAKGVKEYALGLDFCERHNLPVSLGFAMLAGTIKYGNIKNAFTSGKFKVKDEGYANRVAELYSRLIAISPELKRSTFVEACASVCRVEDFDPQRMIANAKRCREKLAAYSTCDAFLSMIEDVYNFGRAKLVGIKAQATMVMRERGSMLPGRQHAGRSSTPNG